jgi:hypothetical protein
VDLVYVLLYGLIGFVSNQVSQLFFEPIRFFKSKPLCTFDQGSAFKLSLDSTHDGREALVGVVPIGVPAFDFTPFGEPLVGGLGGLRRQTAVLPGPRTVGADVGLFFDWLVGLVREAQFVLG